MSCYFVNHYPEPSRIWNRFENSCNNNSSDLVRSIEQMRLKSSILQHTNNSSNETKSKRIANLAKGYTRTKSYPSRNDFELQIANRNCTLRSSFVSSPTSASDVPGKPMNLVRNVFLKPHIPVIRRKMVTSGFKRAI